MAEDRTEPLIVHFVGSIPLPDAETVFRRLAQTTGAYSVRPLSSGLRWVLLRRAVVDVA